MKKISVRTMCFVGLMAALCFAGNYARIILPVSVGGNTAFTLGNITCVLSGLLLGPIGGLASGIGAACYDLTNPLYIHEVPFTFLNKGILGLVAGLVAVIGLRKQSAPSSASHLTPPKGNSYSRYVIAAILGCLSYYILYFLKSYFYNGLVVKGLEPAMAVVALLEKIPASVFNGAIAILVAPPLAIAIQKAMKSAGLKLN